MTINCHPRGCDNLATDDDSNNQTVDTDDTSHNNGDNVLHDKFGLHHTHAANTNTRLGGSVRSTQVSEDQSYSSTHEAKERGASRAAGGENGIGQTVLVQRRAVCLSSSRANKGYKQQDCGAS